MTLRSVLALIALLAAPAALAASGGSQPTSETTTTTVTTTRSNPSVRKTDRVRSGAPLKPRVIEAPGAAVMMIPASYDPTQNGPFSRF